jgi:hypothetical protein
MYHWTTGKWSQADADVSFIFQFKSLGYTLEELDNVNTSLDALAITLDSKAWQGGQLLLGAISTTGQLGTFDGTALAAEFITSEFQVQQGKRALITEVRPLVEGGTTTVAIGHRTRLQDSVAYASATSVNTAGFCPARTEDRYLRLKVAVTGGFDHSSGAEIKPVIRGTR